MELLDIERGIICQQVNCQNVMGAGLAKAIYEKYPIVKKAYHDRCMMYKTQEERSKALYGHYQLVRISKDLFVANIFSQDKFGNGPQKGICFTNAGYLVSSIEKIAKTHPEKWVYIPYGIGCGFGGGNWSEISNAIKDLQLDNIHIIVPNSIQKENPSLNEGMGIER